MIREGFKNKKYELLQICIKRGEVYIISKKYECEICFNTNQYGGGVTNYNFI